MNKPYQLNQETGELLIYGDITSLEWLDSDKSSYSLANKLKELNGADLTVRINSKGGEVSEGLAMYNLLKSYQGNVTTICDGFACSIASVVFMAGSKRVMSESSLLMIHNPWTYAVGNADEFRKQADDLEKITEPSIKAYLVSNLSEEEIRQKMKEETWITSQEALDWGFATEVRKNEARQSADDEMVLRLVRKLKEYEKAEKAQASESWFF